FLRGERLNNEVVLALDLYQKFPAHQLGVFASKAEGHHGTDVPENFLLERGWKLRRELMSEGECKAVLPSPGQKLPPHSRSKARQRLKLIAVQGEGLRRGICQLPAHQLDLELREEELPE